MIPYQYLKTDTMTDDVDAAKLQSSIEASGILGNVLAVNVIDDNLYIYFDQSLSSGDKTILDGIVTSHEHTTAAEQLKDYLDKSVFPFVNNLINTFAAENISMGITQAGKTGDVLGLFQKSYDIGYLHPVSLKGSFDTGSLYISLEIIQHVRDNAAEYTGLGPYVTDARLLEMKNKIETFLGITPLST